MLLEIYLRKLIRCFLNICKVVESSLQSSLVHTQITEINKLYLTLIFIKLQAFMLLFGIPSNT